MRQIVGSGNKEGRYLVVLGKPGKFDSERGRRSAFSNTRSYEVIAQTLIRAGVDPKDCYFIPAVSRYKENWKPAEIIADAEQYILPLLNVKNRRAIAFGGTAAVALGLIKSLDGVSSLYGQACRTSLGGVSKWATVTNDPFFLFKEPEEINKAFLHVYYGIQRIQKLKGSNSDLLEFPKFEVCMLDSVEDIEEMMHCYSGAISGDDFFEKHMAYDHETTQLDAKKALIATTAFCNGQWTDAKGFKSWLWAPYDSLVPRFSVSKEKKLEKTLMEFYRMLHRQQTEFEGQAGGRVAHNRIYDDWVTHTNYQEFLGSRPMFSLWDTKIMSWQMDSLSRNGLKEMYERLFGVPNYDEKIEAAVREVTSRRQASKALVDPADFRTLKVLGHAPRVVTKKNGDETLKWPKELGAKEGAYAAVPLDVLGPYNCMDAVATWQMFTHQHAWLEEQGMLDVCKWKHHVSIRLHEATMHGLPTDKKMNRKWSAQLTELEVQCADIVRNSLEELGVSEDEIEKFKAGSPDHVRAILFGKPAEVPALDTAKHEEALMELFGGMKKAKSVVSSSLNALWSSPSFKKAAQAGSLDKKEVSQAAKELIHSEFGISDPAFTTSKHYFGGLLQPKEDAFTKTGLPSVSKVVLERHLEEDAEEGDKARKFIKSLLMLSRIRKIRGTFVDGIYKQLDGVWCHPYYNEIGTKSGRGSSSNPNGQNYIKKIRGQHLALKGHTFFEFDFSQAEIRVAAAMSQDPKLMEVVASGADLHTLTAMFMFNVSEAEVKANDNYRKAAKTLNFGIIYGLSAFRLAKTLKISVDEAEELIMERYFGLYKRLAEWMQEEKLLASKPPYFVTTPAGTRISTLNTLSYNPEIRSHAERLAVNAQVQGGAGELAFHVIDRLCERIEANGWLNEEGTNGFCNTVHDSAAFMIWNKLKLAWYESGTDGQSGRVVGPLVEELQAIVESPAPWSPLDTVPFKVDIELNTRWAGMPDLMSAIDPNFKKLDKRAVEWDLIDIEKLDRIHLTAEEKREIEEIKELEGEVVLY